jgi:hypothetical protein
MSNNTANGKRRWAHAMKIMLEKPPSGLSEGELEEFKREQLRRAYAAVNTHPHVTHVNNNGTRKTHGNNGSKKNNASKKLNNGTKRVKKWAPVATRSRVGI